MNWRDSVLVLIGILCFAQSVAVNGQPTEPTPPAQCQPCPSSAQYVQCPAGEEEEDDHQCPRYFLVSQTPASGPCQLPSTTAAAPATTTTAAVVDGGGNSSSAGELNSTSEPDSTTTPTTTTTTTIIPTTPTQPSNNNSDNATDTTTPPSTTTPTSITCRICLEHCQRCNGSGPEDCLECRAGRQLRANSNNGLLQCVKDDDDKDDDEDSGLGLPVIIGASAGGGAVLLVVIVVVACVCCRRHRRGKRDQELGPGMMIMDDVTTQSSPQQPREKQEEEANKAEDVEKRPPKYGVDAPEYVNVKSAMPRPISIERGHDKVLRYVRDPTVKKPEPDLPADTEERELADLPTAPVLPAGVSSRKRSIDTGDSQDHPHHHPHPHHDHHHPPHRTHTAPDPSSSKPDWKRPHGGKAAGTSATLPAPHASSDPYFPKFPIEEEMERQEREASGGSRAAAAAAAEQDLEDPEMDYENLGPKARLGEPADAEVGKRSGGVFNPGMEGVEDEEPEDEYVNQAAIKEVLEDIDEHPYQNLPPRGVR